MNRATVAAAYLLPVALSHIGVAAQPAAPASAPTSYFSDLDAAAVWNLQSTAPRQKRDLGFIARWRYESCLTDAAKNPTTAGVNLARRVCDQKFGQ